MKRGFSAASASGDQQEQQQQQQQQQQQHSGNGLPCPEGMDAAVWCQLPLAIQEELSGGQRGGAVSVSTSGPPSKALKTLQDPEIIATTEDRKTLIPTMFQSQRCGATAFYYTDTEFPPEASSIDGRHSVAELTAALKCSCNKPARIRKVQKAGVNQGRFFYSCGGFSERGIPVAAKDNGCNFFSWAAHAPHSERVQRIQWKRCLGEDGWGFSIASRGFRAEDVLQVCYNTLCRAIPYHTMPCHTMPYYANPNS
jgi:hypothetical protein